MENCIYCGKKLEGKETTCPQCQREIKEYKDFDSYTFKPIAPDVAAALENLKGTLFFKGDQKKMAEAIRGGKAGIAPVVVENIFNHSVPVGDDEYRDYPYANVADPDGYPAPKAVRILDRYDTAENLHMEAYLLSYTLKKTSVYVVLDQQAVDSLSQTLMDILVMPETDLIDRALPVMEGSIADKGAKFFSKLFKKK